MKGIQNTSTLSFSNLIGNSEKFVVPMFQRDYSWEQEQWDDLWQDITTMIEEKDEHYMGYLVLQSGAESNTHKIIDGQQRFTTITLLLLALIKAIKCLADNTDEDRDANKQRYMDLMTTYIGRKNPVTLEYNNILTLNKHNDSFYKDYIVKLEELRPRGLSTSDKLMKQCFLFFEKKVKELSFTGIEYAEYIITIVNNLYFTVINVNDELNAFRVFETLNARGVQLSSADLLKNYVLSIADNGEEKVALVNDLNRKWDGLAHNVRQDKLPDFIRYYWNTKNTSVRSADLFKNIRKTIKTPEDAFRFVNDMMDYSDIYMALINPDDELWDGIPNSREVRDNIELLNLFRLKQPLSILMTAYKNLSIQEFSKLLNTIIMICFRYNVVCRKNPNAIENVFNENAKLISAKQQMNYNLFKSIYVDDKEFARAFAVASFPYNARNRKIITYIFSILEHQNDNTSTPIDYTDEQITIEHILPLHPNDDDWNFDEFKLDQLVYRIGNMCLIAKKDNKNIGNLSYDEKAKVYSKSSYTLTKNIPDQYSAWTEREINKRQVKLSNLALSYWKVPFLSK